MLRVKSLMCETAAVVGGFYYLTKTVHLDEKEIGKGCFQFNKTKLVHAEADLPSCNLKLKDTSDVEENDCGRKWETNWDRLEPPNQSPLALLQQDVTTIKMRRMIFVADGSRQPRNLSPQGRLQGVEAGRRIKKSMGRLNVTPKAKGCDMQDFTAQINNGYGRATMEWENEKYLCSGTPYKSDPPRDGVGAPVLQERIIREHAMLEAAYRRIFYRPQSNVRYTNEVFACKKNTIKFFVVRALQLPLIAWDRFTIIPGSITCFIIGELGLVTCNSISSIGHFNPREDNENDCGSGDRPRPPKRPDTGRPNQCEPPKRPNQCEPPKRSNQCEPPKRPSCSTPPDDAKQPRASTGERSEPGTSGGGRCAERRPAVGQWRDCDMDLFD